MSAEDAHILAILRAEIEQVRPKRLGIAVSGGSDSTALMHAARQCLGDDVVVMAATVDHGLRPESALEAENVAEQAKRLGIHHKTLKWKSWDGSGNLQDQARRARRALLVDWAKNQALDAVALGHTANDQAETVVMRLARSAGVDGLAAMQPVTAVSGVTFLRPLLALTRDALQAFLQRNGVGWIEDPSNIDERFDRVRVRNAMAALADVGITVRSLNDVASNMTAARDALDAFVLQTAKRAVTVDGGDLVIEINELRECPFEIARRLLVRSLVWMNGDEYPPRRDSIQKIVSELSGGGTSTLAGCLILSDGIQTRITREFSAVRNTICSTEEIWDGRWEFSGPKVDGAVIRVLGEDGLKQCPDWRASGRPYASALASPSVWAGGELLAAPLAGEENGWQANLVGGAEGYFSAIISH